MSSWTVSQQEKFLEEKQLISFEPGSSVNYSLLRLLLLSHSSRVQLCATPQTAAHQAARPWDSPGKNTGVGCISFSNAWKWKVKSENDAAQSCPTRSDPTDCSLPASSIHGIFQARVLEWGTIAFSLFLSRSQEGFTDCLIHISLSWF